MCYNLGMYLAWQSIKFIFLELLWQTIWFPFWWYGKGTVKFLSLIITEIKDFSHAVNLGILARYLFQPMYGLRDFWSRFISFPVRLVYLLVLLVLVLIWTLILLSLLVIWLMLPIFALYNVLFQLNILQANIYGLF